MLKRVFRIVGSLLGVLGLAGIIWTAQIWSQYQRTLPHEPDVHAGRVYALNVHGIVVYENYHERDWRNTVQYTSIALFAASGLMAGFYQWKFSRLSRGPRQ